MLAVLSYHSWDVGVAQLRNDVHALRRAGWTTVSSREALAFARGERAPTAGCVLVTTDDGHVEDEEWAGALRELECPAVTFVCSSLVPVQRRGFYQRLAESDEFAVEDHGFRHMQHTTSSRVRGYVAEPTPLRAVAGRVLAPGEPLLATASEVAYRRFDPDPGAIAMLTSAAADASPEEIQSGAWRASIERELVRRGLAVRRFGAVFLRGRFETNSEYEKRVTEYLREGQEMFKATFGRPPRLYAYTWWEGNATTDAVLRRLGYAGSFRGTGAVQPPDGRTFAIPRIPVGPIDPRPLDLYSVPVRSRLPRFTLDSLRSVAKQALGIG